MCSNYIIVDHVMFHKLYNVMVHDNLISRNIT